MNNFVTLNDLAQQLGMDKSFARKYVLSLGVTPQKHRNPSSGQKMNVVTQDDAAMITATRQRQGYVMPSNLDAPQHEIDTETGVFYLIQLIPEYAPQRIKLGFTQDMKDRMRHLVTSAPTAKVVKTWPCKRSWESTMRDILTIGHCEHVLNEVFECENMQDLLDRADALFVLFPKPTERVKRSQFSPNK